MNILSGIENFIKDSLGVNGTKKVKSSTYRIYDTSSPITLLIS